MKFAALVLLAGIAGMLLAANLQGTAAASSDRLVAVMQPSPEITGSLGAPASPPAAAIRLIDLRNGATCKVGAPAVSGQIFRRMPIGPDCTGSPELARVAYWRSASDGTLIMADTDGATVLEFAPGDGVLFESVYPATAMITIVPARG